MEPIELVASVLGLACVWLTVRRHIACWPTGLAMVSLYAVVFYRARLYSDMLLQIVYIFMQFYGWYAWLRGGPDRGPLIVSRLSPQRFGLWIVAGIVASGCWGAAMQRFTDASYPFVDALAAVASLIAQWLMGRKVLESWLVWIFVNVVSIWLYFAKELYPTAVLYVIFLGLASWGWFEWKAAWTKQGMA